MSGAVSTSHHLATDAGATALRRGGNAIDAAIAAAAVLCVVYPNNVALGGDLVALVRDPEGRTRFVNATGRAARAVDPDALRARYGRALPDRGVDTVTVPGGLRGWAALAGLGARLAWGELLEDAHRHAHGHPTARSVARAIAAERAVLEADPGCRDVFLAGGSPLAEGEELRQPRLAETLAVLRREGPDAFYSGPVATAWIDGLRRLGHPITEADAAALTADVGDPLTGDALGVRIITSPPNTQGFALLRAARALDSLGLRDPLGADAGALAEAFAASNRVRSALLADPDVGLSGEALLTASADLPATDDRVATGDTVGLVAVSDDGWAVSLVQSVYWAFGSAILEPETGVLFQNRGTSFSLDAGHPATLAPWRRPPHTLMPVIVERAGELTYAAGTMGAQAQAQIHAQLLLRVLAGESAADATSAPRWVVGEQQRGDTADTLTAEADVPASAIDTLAATRFTMKIVPAHSEPLGHSNLIVVRDDGLDAASDPRSDGSAVVV
ncbi:gamma-glutamyltransferase family protein [Microbacterium aureliae]